MRKLLHNWFGIGRCRREWVQSNLDAMHNRMRLRVDAAGVTITHVGGCRG